MNTNQAWSIREPYQEARKYRYPVACLKKIGGNTTTRLNIPRVSVEAFQAGIVSGPCTLSKQYVMPLGAVSVNRHRGWSLESFGSSDDYVVFQEGRSRFAERQSRSTQSETLTPLDDGFARFLKQHSSPTHQRVTAGGHIVPMQPIPPPPQFNLFPDSAGPKSSLRQHKEEASGDRMKAKQLGSVVNTAVRHNHDQLPSHGGHRLQTSKSCQTQKPMMGPNLNTGEKPFEETSHMLRSGKFTHPNAADHVGLPYQLPNLYPSFDLNTQTYIPRQWAHLGLPLSCMVFDPYANMLIPNGDPTSAVPTPLVLTPPYPSVAAADQNSPQSPYGEGFDRLVPGTVQPGFWPSWNPPIPISPFGADLFSHQSMLASQIGANNASMPPFDLSSDSRMCTGTRASDHTDGDVYFQDVQNSTAKSVHGNVALKVTEADVGSAEKSFRELDVKLQGHDRYTASHYSSLSPQTKSYYVAERMQIVEQRDLARRKWVELNAQLDRQRCIYHNASVATKTNRAALPISKKAGVANQSGNTQFNVQAADWVPKRDDENQDRHIPPYSAADNAISSGSTNSSMTNNPPANLSHSSSTGKLDGLTRGHCLPPQNTHGPASASTPKVPGPYTRQLNNTAGEELSDMEIDEWGVRRGFAPPQLAQKQSEEAMQIQHEAGTNNDISESPPEAADSSTAAESSAHAVDEWGVRVGGAPPDVARQQYKQSERLTRTKHQQEGHMSASQLDDSLPASDAANKPAALVESQPDKCGTVDLRGYHDAANATGHDGVLSEVSSLEQGSGPTQADWEAVFKASQKGKGEKTNVYLATGHVITVEGQGSTQEVSGADAENTKPMGIAKQPPNPLVDGQSERGRDQTSAEKGLGRSEAIAGKAGGSILNPWAYHDENNFFRHKGPSSVALQSVTAQGMLPGFDGSPERQGPQAMRMASAIVHKASGSPVKRCSPPKRTLRDIWSPTQAKIFAQESQEKFGEGMDRDVVTKQ